MTSYQVHHVVSITTRQRHFDADETSAYSPEFNTLDITAVDESGTRHEVTFYLSPKGVEINAIPTQEPTTEPPTPDA